MSDDLRRVLKDPAHRLPDSLVDLDSVHAAARRHQRRRTGLAAVGGAVAVVAISLAVVQPWAGTDQGLPVASTQPTPIVSPSPSIHSSPPPSPTPDPSGGALTANRPVVGVSAVSDTTWWVLTTSPATCVGRCGTQLLETRDSGRSFVETSSSMLPDGIPAGTTTVRFLPDGWIPRAFALVPSNPVGRQLFVSSDHGATWHPTKPTPSALALEAGGGTAWLLVEDGRRIGVLPLGEVGDALMASGPIWLGNGNGVAPALTVQGGQALVFWFTESESRLSEVGLAGGVRERVNPCTRDVGIGAVSATVSGLAVSCHLGSTDGARSSDDGGRTWSSLQDGPGRLVVGNINSGLTVIGGQDGRLTLAAPGASQPMVTHGAKANGAWTWIGFTSETSGFALDEAGQLFRTTDRGSSWTRLQGTVP